MCGKHLRKFLQKIPDAPFHTASLFHDNGQTSDLLISGHDRNCHRHEGVKQRPYLLIEIFLPDTFCFHSFCRSCQMFQKLFPAETAVIDQGTHRQNFLFIRDDHRLTWDLTKNDISHSFHIFPLSETFSQIDKTLVRDSHGKAHPLRKQTVLTHIHHIKGLEKEHHSHRIHDDHRDGNLSHKLHGRAERLRDHQNDHHLQDLRLCSQEKQIDAVHLPRLVLFINQASQHAFHQR